MRKQQLFFTTILLVIVVFAIGVIVGSAWQSQGLSSVDRMLKQSELSTESFLVEQDLFKTFDTSCELADERLATLHERLSALGKVLEGEDAREELGEDNYNYLKRKYHLMQVRTYILYKNLKDNCGIRNNVVLFYFSSRDDKSREQGEILDSVAEKRDLKVFAVEYNYSDDLSFMEDFYEVSSTPTLIVNFEKKLESLVSEEEIIPLLYGQN